MIAPKALSFLENRQHAWPTDTQNPRCSKLDSLSLHPNPKVAAPLCSLATLLPTTQARKLQSSLTLTFSDPLHLINQTLSSLPLKCLWNLSNTSHSPLFSWVGLPFVKCLNYSKNMFTKPSGASAFHFLVIPFNLPALALQHRYEW